MTEPREPDQTRQDCARKLSEVLSDVAKWVNGYGWIQIGETDWQGFQVRALDAGGWIYENTACDSLAAAMPALEMGLGAVTVNGYQGAWFKEQDR